MDYDFSISTEGLPALTPKPPIGPTRKLLRHLDGDDYVMNIDWTSISSFLECPRKGFWSLILSRSSYPGPALAFGSAVHAGLEEWYIRSDENSMLNSASEYLNKYPVPPGEWRDQVQLDRTLKAYIKRYPTEQFEHDKVMVERPFSIPLGEIQVDELCQFDKDLVVFNSTDKGPFHIANVHVQWTGIIDLFLRSTQGKRWVMDHKTTSIAGPTISMNYEISQQLVGYSWAAEELLQEEIEGCILNLIIGRKPTKTGVAIDFERYFFSFGKTRKANWKIDMLSHCQSLLSYLTSPGFSFPENTLSCVRKFGVCAYHRVCTQDEEQDKMALVMSDIYCNNVWDPLADPT